MILSRIKGIYYAIEFVLSVCGVIFLMWLFPKSNRKIRRFWAKTQRWFGFYKLEISGEICENAQILLINHKSMLDIVVLEELHPKNLCWIAKKEIGKLPILGKILSLPKMIAVDRSDPRAIVHLLKEAKDRIANDRVLAIFPEGTRAKGEKLLKFQSGAKVIADKLNLVAQPVVIVGSDIMDVKNFTFKNGKIKVIFLDPVDKSNENWLENTRTKMQSVLDKEREILKNS
ncbi:MAG: 1-acyl-sn-glycerol-3-phosphate acyltransferase [Campylobacter sp.]|nr:1-acyl-sn-glycerol-3-phosphate acyltransferase [Campylobacter sp.]